MALTRQDVLDTLNSYFVTQMDFWVDKVHVCARSYDEVRTLIEDFDITVVEGTNPTNAYYNAKFDTLTTQNVPSPPDVGARSLLLHECTHAIVDVQKLSITELTNEVTAYIAQTTYKLLADPNYKVGPDNPPWFAFYNHVVDFVKKFKLHTPEGRGKIIPWADYSPLRTELNHLNIYTSITDRQRSDGNGVPVKPHGGRFADDGTSFQLSAHEPFPEPTDEYLLRMLEKRYAANDVAGFGGRVKELEQLFLRTDRVRAKALLPRIETRKPGDKISIAFHDHLSTAERVKLAGILRAR